MGSVFKHVDDEALRTSDGSECHLWARTDVSVYTYFGKIVDSSESDGSVDDEVDELCADCINSGRVQRRNTFEAERIISRFATDRERAWAEFHQLPDVPLLLQGFDWPMCCGNWADFTGSPESEEELALLRRRVPWYWEEGPTEAARDFEH